MRFTLRTIASRPATLPAIVAVAAIVASAGALGPAPAHARQADTPPVPDHLDVWNPDTSLFDTSLLQPWEARFAMGRAGKDGPLDVGEKIQAGAEQVTRLEITERDGREAFARSFEIFVGGAEQPIARGAIYLDRHTLLPLGSEVVQQGQEIETVYDWQAGEVRQVAGGAEASSVAVDQRMIEAAAHDVWMAAIDWDDWNGNLRIPSVMPGMGSYWLVPRLVGTETFDLGDGVGRDAWVVELDWWHRELGDYYPGGGANGTAGIGGKYWILQEPPPGYPRVVRIRTERDAENDQVVQIQ